MPPFSYSIAIRSQEVREDPYDLMKILDKYYVIFPYGIDGVFLDISMLNIKIIEIEN